MNAEEKLLWAIFGEPPLPINPDCRDGKHPACNGDAWDDTEDRPADCLCDCHVPVSTTTEGKAER